MSASASSMMLHAALHMKMKTDERFPECCLSFFCESALKTTAGPERLTTRWWEGEKGSRGWWRNRVLWGERSSRRTSKDARVRLLVSPNAIRMSATVLTAEGYRHLNTAISLLPWRQTQRKELWWAQTEWMMREQAVVFFFFFIFVIICTNPAIAKTEFKCFWSDKITRLV